MADETRETERIVDLDTVGDVLPDLIEEAARRGERLVVERGGVRLAVLVPDPKLREPFGYVTRGEAFALLDRMPAAFADQSQEDIERETERAIAEVRSRANPVSDDELRAVLDAVRANFADQSEEDIERETAKALTEARADLRAERSEMRKAS